MCTLEDLIIYQYSKKKFHDFKFMIFICLFVLNNKFTFILKLTPNKNVVFQNFALIKNNITNQCCKLNFEVMTKVG
jgi:hypothetical protein